MLINGDDSLFLVTIPKEGTKMQNPSIYKHYKFVNSR
jgi:hypothetical protein